MLVGWLVGGGRQLDNSALSHSFLSIPTCNRHFCELLFNGSYINPRIDLIDFLFLEICCDHLDLDVHEQVHENS